MELLQEIKAWHDLEQLCGYSTWCREAVDIFQMRQALEAEDEEFLGENVSLLKEYLKDKEQPFSDIRLLEIACFIPGLRRRRTPPLIVLNKKRGGFSENRLSEACEWVQQCDEILTTYRRWSIDRKQVIATLQNVQLASDEDDVFVIAQMILRMTSDIRVRERQRKLIWLYYQMLESDVIDILDYALDLFKHDNKLDTEIAEDILKHTAYLQSIFMKHVQQQLLDLRILYPAILFIDASREISEQITQAIHPDDEDFYWLLEALMWTRNELAVNYLSNWTANPPHWWAEHINAYSLVAGWEIDRDGQRRDLYFDQCYPLVDDKSPASQIVMLESNETCLWCQQPLNILFDLDLTDPRLDFLGITGNRLIVPICRSCVVWRTIFFDVDYTGKAVWSSHNKDDPPTRKIEYSPIRNRLTLGQEPRQSPFEVELIEKGTSQIGGHPLWLNDSLYPVCPECQMRMQVIGQLALLDISLDGGWIYAYLCKACHRVATNFYHT